MLSAAGANAGTSSAAPASSSAAAAAVLEGSVFVKQFGDGDAVYAEVGIYVGDKVARLAERAFAKFRWPGAANKVKLYLVKQTGDDEPTAEEEEEAIKRPRLGVGLSLLRAGIASGAWVVARLEFPAAAACTCTRAARRSLLVYLSSRGRVGACARLFRWDLCRRSP